MEILPYPYLTLTLACHSCSFPFPPLSATQAGPHRQLDHGLRLRLFFTFISLRRCPRTMSGSRPRVSSRSQEFVPSLPVWSWARWSSRVLEEGTPWLAAVAEDTPALLMAMSNSRRASMRILFLFSWRLRRRMDGRRTPNGDSKVSGRLKQKHTYFLIQTHTHTHRYTNQPNTCRIPNGRNRPKKLQKEITKHTPPSRLKNKIK